MYLSKLGDWKNILRQKRQRKLSENQEKKLELILNSLRILKKIKKRKRRENERAKTLEI